MSLTLKEKIITFFSPILLPLYQIYWRTFKPRAFGVKVAVKYQDKYLIVKHTYGKKRWTFPGGKTEKRETPKETAVREIKEEFDIDIDHIEHVGQIIDKSEGKVDTIEIYRAIVDKDTIQPSEFEIGETRWCSPGEMPELGPVAKRIFDMLK